jgi:hypothetical protein
VRAQVRRRWGVVAALVVLFGTSGCGFVNDLAHPEAAGATVETSPPAEVVPAVGTPVSAGPRVIVDGALTTTAGDAGHLTVTVGRVRTGLVPPVPHIADCPMDGPSLQYVAVGFTSSAPGLAAHVAISRGPATPADVVDVGVFAESGNGLETYCDDAPPLPTWDKFWNQMGAETVSVYVVLDQAVTAATPDGRSEVFPTMQLRISDLRLISDRSDVRGLGVGQLSVGAACADAPDAICVPLG